MRHADDSAGAWFLHDLIHGQISTRHPDHRIKQRRCHRPRSPTLCRTCQWSLPERREAGDGDTMSCLIDVDPTCHLEQMDPERDRQFQV